MRVEMPTGKPLLVTITALLLSTCPYASSAQRQPRTQRPPQPSSSYEALDVDVLHPMALGCEFPSVRLDLVTTRPTFIPLVASERIRLSYGSQSILLRQLHGIRGHVRIADAPTALRFARLLTSPETWFLWQRQEAAAEIVEANDSLTLPNFGLKEQPLGLSSQRIGEAPDIKNDFQSTTWQYSPRTRKMDLVRTSLRANGHDKILKSMNPPDFTILGDGYMGVLTQKAYREGGFSPATVAPVSGGFQIMRWLYLADYSGKQPKESVQRVQEFVGVDGEYRRIVITTLSPPPELSDVKFSFPWLI